MKNLIVLMMISCCTFMGMAQPATPDMQDFKSFINEFKDAYAGTNVNAQQACINLPFEYDILGYVVDEANWDSFLVNYFDFFQLLAGELPYDISMDFNKIEEIYSVNVEYSEDENSYVINVNLNNENLSSESLYIKKIDGKFKFYRCSYFDLSILGSLE
jgi:hypothetical protein